MGGFGAARPIEPWLDPSGRQRLNSVLGEGLHIERVPDVALRWPYNINTIENVTTTSGTGTVATSGDLLTVATGATAGSAARLASTALIRYRPGSEVFCMFTSVFTSPGIAGCTQAIGIFDSSDGFAVGYNGKAFGIRWRVSSVDTWIPQSDFNKDTLGWADMSKIQLWRITFAWFGGAPIFFEILRPEGTWQLFHVIQIANVQSAVSIHNPSLPATLEVVSSTSATNVSLSCGCIEGGSSRPSNVHGVGYRNFTQGSGVVPKNLSTSTIPLLSIKNPVTFQGLTNKTAIRFVMLNATTATAGTEVQFDIVEDATLTGASFSAVDATNSVAQYDISATAFSGGTSGRFSATVATGTVPYYLDDGLTIYLYPGHTLTVTAVASGSSTGAADLIWQEQY